MQTIWWYLQQSQKNTPILTTPPRYNEREKLLPSMYKQISRWRLSGLKMPRGWEARAAKHGGADYALPLPQLLQMSRWTTWQQMGDNIRALIAQAWLPPWMLDAHPAWQHRNYLHPQRAPPTYGDRDMPHDATQQQRISRLACEALWAPCMPMDQLHLGYALPPGCVCHALEGTTTTARVPSQRAAAAASHAGGGPRYLRVQLAAGVHEYAHRLLCWLRLGPPPIHTATGQPMEATHLCNNKSCLNPYHITWVSARCVRVCPCHSRGRVVGAWVQHPTSTTSTHHP